MPGIHVPFAVLAMNLVVLVAVLSCLNSGLYVPRLGRSANIAIP